MRPCGRNKHTEVRTVFWLRLLFFSLVAGCLMQIAFHDASSIIPPSTPVFYVLDESNNLRVHDPDSPFPKRRKVPKKVKLDPLYSKIQKRIDEQSAQVRCDSFGVPVLPENERNKRRIFMGAMLADENPEVLAANAVEVYNKYHVVALVESNTTHSGKPRKMNFGPNSISAKLLQETELFGNQTKVVLDYWLEDMKELKDMDREVEQRNTIWKIWVDQGMTPRDIGIMTDLDEIVSREFLHAIQLCDFPKLRYDPRPSCQKPKMSLSSIQYEGSPLCIQKDNWHHPDLILGNCVEGVGDSSGRAKPERNVKGSNDQSLGFRTVEWGKFDYNQYPKEVIDSQRFPLWDGRDMRGVNGNADRLVNFMADTKNRRKDRTVYYGAAYHLHNWFKDTNTLRQKYATYGHPDDEAKTKPLSAFKGDLNMMVRCVRGLGNDIIVDIIEKDPNSKAYHLGKILNDNDDQADIFSIEGNKPIYFENKEYLIERHALVKQMIRADEEKYGTLYPFELDPREEKESEKEGKKTSEQESDATEGKTSFQDLVKLLNSDAVET